MKERLLEHFQRALRQLLDEAGDSDPLPEFALESPKNPDHGDFACNAAMLLAKRLRCSPRQIGQTLIDALLEEPGPIDRAELAGPGFVNVWLSEDRWQGLLGAVLREGAGYGRATKPTGRRVQVEFVSANPTGPLTLGHGRQAVLGDCLARMLEAAGEDVTREYYFNNGGRQMRVLGESVKARYLEHLGRAAPPPADALADPDLPWPDEIEGLPVLFPRDGYQGDYIGDLADLVRAEAGDALDDEPGDGLFRQTAETRIFAEIRRTLERLGIEFDVFSNEMDLYESGSIEETLASLRERGLVYDADEAVWLRATALGLDRDRVLVKRSGEPTYLLPDVAYHREKFRRGFDLVIDVQGADHIEQFPFVKRAAGALGCPEDRIELVMNQFVTLSSGGAAVKQSTRKATYVTVDELVGEVGTDVFRYFMLERRAESHLDFDLSLAKEKDWKKNPAYYLQYAHARTYGIERKAREQGISLPDAESVDASPLELPEEIELLKKLGELPEVIARAAEAREPHHIAYYARGLARLWNTYIQDGSRHRVLGDDPALTQARLGLVLGVRAVIAGTLDLMGLSAPEQM
jgi:arginyl-tRNA synthetase